MSKKIFTLLLLAVFMLAQFSMVSAATMDGTTAIAPLDTFHADTATIDLDWSVTEMDGVASQFLYILLRNLADPANDDWQSGAAWCQPVQDVSLLTSANGTFPFPLGTDADDDQDVDEFRAILSDQVTCAAVFAALEVDATDPAQASTFIDEQPLLVFGALPPSTVAAPAVTIPVACNTFEMWALAADGFALPSGFGYSGFDGWNQSITGTFAPPAPEGPASELLSWEYTFPSTASGPWTFMIAPKDVAGNAFFPIDPVGAGTFRPGLTIAPDELEDCADFSDTAGHADEVYIRYLADLGLISGFADGTYGPDTTLTRAEAATLFEKANGVTDADPGFGTPPPAGDACEFTDVSAADWFAGWVWQACADGFMNGIGGGLFDPNNLLTRGQVVTVMNNIALNLPAVVPPFDSFLDSYNLIQTHWGLPAPFPMRTGVWTDVSIGAYYATPVIKAYGWGVAEGTSDTTFSPDAPATRGEFAKWLYRALSRTT